jgi:DnaJ-class molecular chaperone
MKQVTDYYAVLGVDAHAPTAVIKKAFIGTQAGQFPTDRTEH